VSTWLVDLGLILCCFRVSSALVTMRFWLVCCVGVVDPLCRESVRDVWGCMACI